MAQMHAARVAPEKQGSIAPLPAAAYFKRESAMETQMARKTYAEKLRDPRWQRLRLEVMQRAEFRCEKCTADDRTLNVHHKIYRKGADPWDYEAHELECLCEDCHEEKHELISALNEAVAQLDESGLHELVGYAEALAAKLQCTERIGTRSPMHAEGLSAAFCANDYMEIYELVDEKDKKIPLEALWELWERRRKSTKIDTGDL